MTGDAGPGERPSRARRPGRTATAAVAALLLVGGGTAVAVGLLDQDAAPPAPAPAAEPAVSLAPPTPDLAPSSPDPGSAVAGVPAPSVTPQAQVEDVAPAPLPVSLSIPAIDVSSDLITLGLATDGTLEVPQPGPDYDKAAWFDGSPRPGAQGPAVIEGHVDSAADGPSVFYELGALAVGDRIDVAREDGSVVTFQVNDVRAYPKDEFPTLEVYGNTAGPELRLITCGGPFDSTAGSYVDNTVVFASMV